MKLYKELKKQFSLMILAIMLLGIMPLIFLNAQTAEEIKNKIDQKSADIAKLEEEIKAYQNELEGLGKQKDSLAVSLKQLDVTKKKLNADISVTQNKIDKTNLQIQNLSSDIGNKENSIGTNMDSIKLEIKKINELESTSLVEMILSNKDFTLIWNDIDNIITVRESMRENVKR